MDDTPEFELHTERWCAGLRFADARPFEPAERALMQGRIQALTRKFWTAVACVPVSIVVPLTSAYLLPRNLGTAWLGAVAMLIAIAIACAAPALFVLRAAAARRNRNAHRHDLEAGEMLRFEGTLEGRSALDEEQKQLLDVGVLAPRPGDPQTLEVLPCSNRVICRRARHPIRWLKVTVAEVAAGPSYAMRVEVPHNIAYLEGAPEVRFLRRALNAHECAELAAHIQRLRRPRVGVTLWCLWLAGWVCAIAINPIGVQHYLRERWPVVAVQAVVLTMILLAYLRALKLAAGLERDTTTGWAFTLHRPAGDESGAADAPAEVEPPDPNKSLEFLPHSRALWNERGRPARWRNLRRAA